jgi:hypothetical protein
MQRLACLAAFVLALVIASAASAAGPWLGVVDGGAGITDESANINYVTTMHGSSTAIRALRGDSVLGSISIAGRWGIPRVTLNGGVGGLSANHRVLVLAQPYQGSGGELQKTTAFQVLDTKPLALRKTVRLNGDFGFDTLSPDGGTLYLIEHASQEELLRYRVRAYDLRADKLLSRVIADKRQKDWLMTGWPVARAAGGDGRWVYTLYSSGDNYPFVHALDTKARTAVCIGLPWSWTSAGREIQSAELRIVGGRLMIAGDHGKGTQFALNTSTFKVTQL